MCLSGILNSAYLSHNQGVDYPGFYTADNYERANKFLEWMAERIHTNGNYSSVFMLEVMNEPVHSGDYPDLAADMIANFYPAAWSRIRAKESDLGVAEDDQLHIQLMVSLIQAELKQNRRRKYNPLNSIGLDFMSTQLR